MSDLLSRLGRGERTQLNNLAAYVGCNVDTLASEMVRGYLRLVMDAPQVLPKNPLSDLTRRALREVAS